MLFHVYVKYLMFNISELHSTLTELWKSNLRFDQVNTATPTVVSGSSL